MEPSEEQQIIINHIKNGKNVVVDACAGSGKSTTILSCAAAMPDKRFLQITYNASLCKENRERVKEMGLKNVTVQTYHSLAVAKYLPTAHTDSCIREILYKKMLPSSRIIPNNIIVLDESQDMTFLYFQLIVKYVEDMGTPFQVLILGDYMQGLYEFKGSDIRFLIKAHEIWGFCRGLTSPLFERCSLKMSYRITNQMADYVNNVMLGEERLLACKEGEPVIYIRNTSYNIYKIVVYYIRELLKKGVKPSEIFVLGGSVKGPNSQIRRIENALSEAGVPCHIPMFEEGKIDEKVIDGKVVFSTFHCVKGRQRPYVFVVGFDQSYMKFYGRTLDSNKCPNTLYVGTTRATKQLFLLETDQYPEDRPLEFLKMTHLQMKEKSYIDFLGMPRTIFYDKVENTDQNKITTHETTPTELIKFIQESVLEKVQPILDDIFVKVSQENVENLEIPTMTKTSRGFYEDVSDLNGIAISALYYDYLTSLWEHEEKDDDEQKEEKEEKEETSTNILYNIIKMSIQMMKPNEHMFLKNEFEKLDIESSSQEDYLYMANLYTATQEKVYFKLKQIERHEYTWLNKKVLGKCKNRMMTVLQEECEVEKPMIEETVIQKKEDEEHYEIDALLSQYFPKKRFRFTARIDLMTYKTVWEIKCTTSITQDHLLQVVVYAWIMRTKFSHFEKEFKIFNIKTGEILLLNADKSRLDDIMILLLRGKYEEIEKQPDTNFIENCKNVFFQ